MLDKLGKKLDILNKEIKARLTLGDRESAKRRKIASSENSQVQEPARPRSDSRAPPPAMAGDPATRRLCALIGLFVALICIFGGYMVGRSGRGEGRRGSDAALLNLTAAADGLYRRARRISPKSMQHREAGEVATRLAAALGGDAAECGARAGAALPELARACLHAELHKLTKAINNASLYLDSLR